MTLPAEVHDFCYAIAELEPSRRVPWGIVTANARFPLVWDANNAYVLESGRELTIEEIRRDLHAALRSAHAPHEHIEFWETSAVSPALAEMRRTGLRPDPDVVMTFEGERVPPSSPDVDVMEVGAPDPGFWPWYRDSLSEFGRALSAEVLDQMVQRIREVFLPAGLRWFVAHIDRRRAGYASMVAASGVAYIDSVVTMPGFRRRGVATAAVSAAIEASRAAGDRSIFLLAEEDGYPQRLYERLGFRVRATVESFTRLMPKA